jgi:glycosyltransferase involved in cell wall biosynthesis
VKVSLVATARNAQPFIQDFLESVRGQTRPPDEFVVVDGGSNDGTYEALQGAEGVTAISETGANIARGRNLAIRAAAHDMIAVSDADCVLAPDWLERILEPLERGADVSAGAYVPMTPRLLEVCLSAHIPDPSELRPGWLPSSRSLAFRREAFDSAGGYPEWLDVGEDMYLNHRWVDAGARLELAPEAVTYWRVRPTLAETWRQYSRYAEGDARASMYGRKHAVRFAAYGFVATALITRRRTLLALLAVAGAAYAARPVSRARTRAATPSARAAAVMGVPAAMAFLDMAKMWGYLRGFASRSRRTPASTRFERELI